MISSNYIELYALHLMNAAYDFNQFPKKIQAFKI